MAGNDEQSTPTILPVSKRTFLKGGGAVLALSLLPWSLRKAMAQEQFDLIVIGGGTAGMPAAIFAAERGARVLIIEKAPSLGGTLFRSGGQMAGAGSVFQAAKGIEDSPDAHYDDIMRINNNSSDPVIARLWADNGAESLNWLAANGFTVHEDHPVRGAGHDFYRTARYVWGPANGISILKVMEPLVTAMVAAKRITVLLNTAAVDLIKDESGAVLGVVAEDDKGKRSDFHGRSVAITSGGCAANPSMFEELHGVPLYSQVAYPFSQGAGLVLGLGAGGYLRGGEKYVGLFGGILNDNEYPSPLAASLTVDPRTRPAWEIFVNAGGERFLQEDHPSPDHREHALNRQPGRRFWAVFDQAIFDQAPPVIPAWSREKFANAFNEHPMFTRAPTLSELGVKAGVHPRMLEESVTEYNAALKSGVPDHLGRAHRPLPIIDPPFYAIRAQGWTLMSFAGLAVDGDLRVIRNDGLPVPNLYAAGEVIGAGATSGNAYTNGSMVTPAITFGRLLGQRIIALTQ